MIILLCILQIILSLIIGISIIITKPNGNALSAITNNFTGGNLNAKTKLNLSPRTKLMILLILLFFGNSIFLTTQINKNPKKHFASNSIFDSKMKKIENNKKDQVKDEENKVPF